MRKKRYRVFADLKLQGGLCIRLAIYWLVCQLVFVLTLIGFTFLSDAQSGVTSAHITPADAIVPALTVTCLLLPVVIVDLLIYSNRFAGPYFRLRKHLRDVAANEQVRRLSFRDKDFYPEVADYLNTIQDKIAGSYVKPIVPESQEKSLGITVEPTMETDCAVETV